MPEYSDFADALVEEVLSDMAGTFFGARKQLENDIDTFKSYVRIIRENEKRVMAKAGFLNHLLLDEKWIHSLYSAVGADAAVFSGEKDYHDDTYADYVPSALTLRGEYIKMITWAYGRLQESCEIYMKGYRGDFTINSNFGDSHVTYRLMESMCALINDKIQAVNKQCSPGMVLQNVKRLDPLQQNREFITGGGAYYGDDCTLNDALAFKPLKCEIFKIRKFPRLPAVKSVERSITRLSKTIYGQKREMVRNLVITIKKKSR